MLRSFAFGVLLVALAAPLRAQTSPPPSVDSLRQVVPVRVVAVRGDTVFVQPKRPRTALLYSLVPTVGGLLLSSVGSSLASTSGNGTSSLGSTLGSTGSLLFFFGPSFGHYYADNNGQAVRGYLIRGGGLALVAAGFVVALDDLFGDDDDGSEGYAAGLIVAGAFTYLGSAVYDVATAPAAARRYNERHRRVLVGAAPVVSRRGVGLTVAARF